MRCFLAIDLPKKVREELIRIQKQVPKDAKLKFVEPENLHLTLKFFGEISDQQINKIRQELKKIKFNRIKSRLGPIGYFPSSTFIRVIWIALEPALEIKKLYQEINSFLEKEKFRKDKQFESHITLARAKFIKNKEEFIKKIHEIKVEPIEFQVDSFSLKKSILTEKGPVYETIFRFESA